jgi:hypothetical protein
MPNQVARSKIERRLQKLEAALTDVSFAVPHTRRWLLYWTEIIAKYMIGELTRETLPGGLIPLEAFQAIVFKGAADTLDTPYARLIRGENRGDREANAA